MVCFRFEISTLKRYVCSALSNLLTIKGYYKDFMLGYLLNEYTCED